ncbi:LCP family protein [Micromonospora sp. DT233]|uniref:LCP family protein n=1 Tax=Micromonospora sp. DT233 TaxID=3393432 RepID=UPI003CF0E553
MAEATGTARRRWRLGLAVLAALVLVAGGATALVRLTADRQSEPGAAPATASPTPPPAAPSPTPPPGADVTGPLNLLLAGVDTRVSVPDWEPHGDAVLVAHVTKELDRAYVFSLPRDLLVGIPAYKKSGYSGGRTKLTHAMSYGSRVPGKPKQPSVPQGYELLRSAVSGYTGLRFDAGAVVTFQGFAKLVDAVGGIDVYIDQRTVSLHRQPDGRHRAPASNGDGYVGPQMVYEKGERHLNGWQALDYARQRYGLKNGDYDRQRHQQQLIRALMRKIQGEGVSRQPQRVEQIVGALGDTLTYAGGPRIVDLAYALGGLPADRLVLVGLPGEGVGKGSAYRGEQLKPVGREFIAALKKGRAEQYLADHPELVVKK